MNEDTETKCCSKCGELKPITEFASIKGKYISICSVCHKQNKKTAKAQIGTRMRVAEAELKEVKLKLMKAESIISKRDKWIQVLNKRIKEQRNKSNESPKLYHVKKETALQRVLMMNIESVCDASVYESFKNAIESHYNDSHISRLENALRIPSILCRCSECNKVMIRPRKKYKPYCVECYPKYLKEYQRQQNADLPDSMMRGRLIAKGYKEEDITDDIMDLHRSITLLKRKSYNIINNKKQQL